MAVKETKTTAVNELYFVRCTECGEPVKTKFFPLNPLLMQYRLPDQTLQNGLDELLEFLNIGAIYGHDILPETTRLIQNGEFSIPQKAENKTEIDCFQTNEKNDPPEGTLRLVKLTITAIVAEFVRMTGFTDVYQLLELQWKRRKLGISGQDLSDEDSAKQMQYARRMAILLRRQLRGRTDAENSAEVLRLMDTILDCAIYEDKQQLDNFSGEDLLVGWRYKMENNRRMPYSLMVVGSAGLRAECSSCCCNHCHKPISYKLGAYEQRIIGVLGTAATGKTTYIAALTDMIDQGGVTAATGADESKVSSDIIIKAQADPQWKRVTAGSGTSAEPGMLWRYRHGYPPQKTRWNDSMALSFLVKSPRKSEEIMYTLADIAGEAFYNTVSEKQDTAAVEAQQKLLYSCDALIMVVSSRQLRNAEMKKEDGGTTGKLEEMVTSPTEVLTCCDAFLPGHPVPTAVVLTAVDEICGGDLRQQLHLAYDIRRCPPLTWSGKDQTLFYNAELMRNTSDALKNYLNTEFGRFMETLQHAVSRETDSPQVFAFAVSSGTQCAPRDYSADEDDSYNSPEQMRMRYREICSTRFGVASPFLWLLACGGILAPGQGDLTYGTFSAAGRKRVAEMLARCLQS